MGGLGAHGGHEMGELGPRARARRRQREVWEGRAWAVVAGWGEVCTVMARLLTCWYVEVERLRGNEAERE